MMSNALSVETLIARVSELDGQLVEVVGLLTFEFEDCSLNHFPRTERHEITEAIDAPYCQSSIWIRFGTGSIQPNRQVLAKWSGKRIRVTGIAQTAKGPDGCGHLGGWACEIEAYSIELV